MFFRKNGNSTRILENHGKKSVDLKQKRMGFFEFFLISRSPKQPVDCTFRFSIDRKTGRKRANTVGCVREISRLIAFCATDVNAVGLLDFKKNIFVTNVCD